MAASQKSNGDAEILVASKWTPLMFHWAQKDLSANAKNN